jgi:uncharacterized RDD family membrane protein YckC
LNQKQEPNQEARQEPEKQHTVDTLAQSDFTRAGFFRRLYAMVYDWLAVIALAMLLTIINLIVVSYGADFGLFDLTGFADPSSYLNKQWWFLVELVGAVWLFYAWFWYDGGQTIGMRAWRLRVQTQNGTAINFKQGLLRALAALFGLGNLLILFMPKQKLSLQDKLTGTEMVMLTKEQNKRIYLRGIEDPNR